MMGFGMMLTMFFWVVLIGFAIYGVVLIITKQIEKKQPNHALIILQERYANGEIDEEEYEQRNKILKDS